MLSYLGLLVLGAVAGLTIFLGLPIAFLPHNKLLKGFLNSIAIGVLLFLLIDILHEVIDAVGVSAEAVFNKSMPALGAVQIVAVVLIGLFFGLLSLVFFEQRFIKNMRPVSAAGDRASDRIRYLAFAIAVGIGLHNFSEGLAIGQSYVIGAIHLAFLLIIGFGLHNLTEGFGIAGPLHGSKPSLKFLILLGLVAGGPTFLGTVVGSLYASQSLSLLFLSVAGGAIIYVVKELLYHGKIAGEDTKMMIGLLLGFVMGFSTDIILRVVGV